MKGHEADNETGASFIWGKAERDGTLQPKEEKGQRDLISTDK